jgi:hypothetical protein
MAEEHQLEMFAEGIDEDVITFEVTTMCADKVLAANLGKHEHVLLIGVGDEGVGYFASHGNVKEWLFWLHRCEEFIMRNSY